MMISIFSEYVEPLLKDINHHVLLQEWNLNIDAAEYEIQLMITCINLLKKINLTVIKVTRTGQHQ